MKIIYKNDARLVVEMLRDINLEKFDLFHTDHGSQYSSKIVRLILFNANVKQSMSAVGKSLENRPIEYFFSVLKEEWLRTRNINNMSIEEIEKDLKRFIEYYNNKRIQLCLNGCTPVEYTL